MILKKYSINFLEGFIKVKKLKLYKKFGTKN